MDGTAPTLIARATRHAERTAIVDASTGAHASYADLLDGSARAAAMLLDGASDLDGARIAFAVAPGADYVVTTWGVCRAGGIAVPVGLQLPGPEVAYLLDDAEPAAVVIDAAHRDAVGALAEERGIRVVPAERLRDREPDTLPRVEDERAALMLYTSGTTGRPKGVVHTHASLRAQVESLVQAWDWRPDDRVLLVLPLHHVHGIVNVLACALWTGATCEVLAPFDARRTWTRLASGELSLFMAVPTIYQRLVDAWGQAPEGERRRLSQAARRLRLMVSGSAALPVTTLERWREITGHTLLERYGMTEIGMALSNTLTERVPGEVGVPLPGVEVKLRTDDGADAPDGVPGEILVRGPTLFSGYWRRPDATDEAFEDGWFRTGDIAVRGADGRYRILGRASVDIIKSGGEKVSALEVEAVLRTHPTVRDCAVVGVPDDRWGERVCAAVVLEPDADPDALDGLRAWGKQQLAPYKVPGRLVAVDELPRNALGKVVKPDVGRLFTAD